MDLATIEAIAAAAEAIVTSIVKAAPAIESGVLNAAPYVQALVGLVTGTNVTQDQLDQSVASVKALSDQFQAD